MLETSYQYISYDGEQSDEIPAGKTAVRIVAPHGSRCDSVLLSSEPEPNANTIQALEELKANGGKRFTSLETLFEDLGI